MLLAIFCISLVNPLLFGSDSDSRLPACCRRNGAHKCSMVTPVSSGPGWFAARCNSYPGPQPFPPPVGAEPAVGSNTDAELVFGKPPSVNTLHGSAVSFDRSNQKRGPPVLPS